MALSRTVTEITPTSIENFISLVFNVPAEGFPYNFVTAVGLKKLE